MDDLTEKINNILNNPEILSNLESFSGLLGLTENSENNNSSEPQQNSQENNINNNTNNNIELMQVVLKLMPVLSELKNQNDKNIIFLNALRPLLSVKKQKKLDTAIPFLQILKILPILKDNNIL